MPAQESCSSATSSASPDRVSGNHTSKHHPPKYIFFFFGGGQNMCQSPMVSLLLVAGRPLNTECGSETPFEKLSKCSSGDVCGCVCVCVKFGDSKGEWLSFWFPKYTTNGAPSKKIASKGTRNPLAYCLPRFSGFACLVCNILGIQRLCLKNSHHIVLFLLLSP